MDSKVRRDLEHELVYAAGLSWQKAQGILALLTDPGLGDSMLVPLKEVKGALQQTTPEAVRDVIKQL